MSWPAKLEVVTNPLTGGNNIVAGTSTLQLPAGVSQLGGSSQLRNGILSFGPVTQGGTRYSAGSSSFMLTSVKDGFIGFRMGFRNLDTAAVATITAKACALPALNTDPKTITPLSVTFGGSTTGTIPQAVNVTEGGITQEIPGYLYSDFIPLSSVARTDVIGADPLFYVRVESAQGIWYGQKNSALQNYVDAGYVFKTGVTTSSAVTNWASTTVSESTAVGPCEVDFYTGGKTCAITVFADSLAQGVDDSINYPLKMSPLLAAAGLKAHVNQNGVSGSIHGRFSGTLRNIVPLKKPQIVIIHNYTVNSAGTLTEAQQAALLAQDLETIVRSDAKPIIVCMHSNVAAAQRTIAMYGGIYPIVDMNSLLCSPYGSILDQYCRNASTDRTHISDAGASVVAAAVVAEIVKLV